MLGLYYYLRIFFKLGLLLCDSQWRSQEFDLGVYVLTSHCNFKTRVNVPHVNKTVTDFGGIYTDIPPVATPLVTDSRLRQSAKLW